MNRISIIQSIVKERKYKRYLEIGTWKGDSFLPIKCNRKIAIDPKFQITTRKKIKWIFKNPLNIFNYYFEMSSEEFFSKKAGWLAKRGKQDLIFIDGLHTFRASLIDVLFSLKYLDSKGTIIIHDCFPPNKVAATPAKSLEDADKMGIEGWKKEWCGDVWKTIVYLKQQYKEELEVFVLNTDYGLGIIRLKLDKDLPITIDKTLYQKVNVLDYEYLISNPKEILGLQEIIVK